MLAGKPVSEASPETTTGDGTSRRWCGSPRFQVRWRLTCRGEAGFERMNHRVMPPAEIIAHDQCLMQWCGSPASVEYLLAADTDNRRMVRWPMNLIIRDTWIRHGELDEKMIDWSSSGVRSWAERCASIPKFMPKFSCTAHFKTRALRRNAFLPGSPVSAIGSRQMSRTPCRGQRLLRATLLGFFDRRHSVPRGRDPERGWGI